jgi:hypothetical protein
MQQHGKLRLVQHWLVFVQQEASQVQLLALPFVRHLHGHSASLVS